jgi:SAM-dependent methyltransferase
MRAGWHSRALDQTDIWLNKRRRKNTMAAIPINESATFYGSKIGRVNAQIMGASCANINRELLEKFGESDSAIFMGLGDGTLVERIAPRFKRSLVVEASDLLVDEARTRFANIAGLKVISSFFESFETSPAEKVSCVLGNHVLEHVDEPVHVLRKTQEWLSPRGIAIFTVPNATSLHRRIGVELGMLSSVSAPSEQDRVIGHQRVYDMERLHADVTNAGYVVAEAGGFNLKLVSQAQMVDWPDGLHEAIYRVSRQCPPEMCSNIYVVVRPS